MASFTLSHVMARLPRVDEAHRAISESIGGLDGVSVQRIPDKMQRPCLVSRNGMLESLVDAMSSWSTSMSGFGGPVGWRDVGWRALC